MKQIVQSARSGKVRLADVPEPRASPGHILVATRASLISAGTERMIAGFARKSLAGKARERPDLVKKVVEKARRDGIIATFNSVLARLDEPLPLGYSAAGEVVAVGAGLEGLFRKGERVAVAGAGLANHAELNLIPRNLAVPVPESVGDDEACFATIGAIALHAVRNLGVALGDVVAVLGVGLVGQLAVQFLGLQGARVVALDYDAGRLTLAQKMGAELALDLGVPGAAAAVEALTQGRGCDAVLIAAATPSSEPLELAAALARDRARLSIVGKTGTEFPYAAFMKKEISLIVSRSYGPGRYDDAFETSGVNYPIGFVRWTETENLRECVRLMNPGLARRLDVAALITHRFPLEQAEAAYDLVVSGTAPHLGVVLRYEPASPPVAKRALPEPRPAAAGCVMGVIGAGSFARAVLLPALARRKDVRLRTIVTQRGLSAEHARDQFGFAHCATEISAVLDDPAINAVLIATRHASHAALAARALEAGKAVLVEKPLALTREELALVEAARERSGRFLLVGFNRRFAPMALEARAHLARRPGAKFLLLRVNAGALAAESWINRAAEGGGRILGELCHFIDLARFFAGSPIISVQADAGAVEGVCEDVSVTLRCADGSLATIAYTAQGDAAFSKERFEAFAGGTVVTIDNFLAMTVTADGRTTTQRARAGQDKGHGAELAAFIAGVVSCVSPVPETELFETSLATIAVLDSLREGTPIALPPAGRGDPPA
ncbi:MAG: bi-domain-containing oxidoreductase [Alphaproteobacteria bacterium]|nr:bi-domain-containing oxidoreductase [Alphaproteobacteria bacterium]